VLRWCRSELNPNYVRKASVTVTFSLCGAFVAQGASGAGLMTDGGVRIREDEPKPAHGGSAAPDTLNASYLR